MPWPTALRAVPMAAVVLPFPGPVFTMIRPRRISCILGMIDCTFFEWAALRLAWAKPHAPTFSKFIFALPVGRNCYFFVTRGDIRRWAWASKPHAPLLSVGKAVGHPVCGIAAGVDRQSTLQFVIPGSV